MAEEPDFIFQTEEPMSDAERQAWIAGCLTEAKSRGGVFFRSTIHEQFKNRCLVEIWKTTMEPGDDLGAPRWQPTAAKH